MMSSTPSSTTTPAGRGTTDPIQNALVDAAASHYGITLPNSTRDSAARAGWLFNFAIGDASNRGMLLADGLKLLDVNLQKVTRSTSTKLTFVGAVYWPGATVYVLISIDDPNVISSLTSTVSSYSDNRQKHFDAFLAPGDNLYLCQKKESPRTTTLDAATLAVLQGPFAVQDVLYAVDPNSEWGNWWVRGFISELSAMITSGRLTEIFPWVTTGTRSIPTSPIDLDIQDIIDTIRNIELGFYSDHLVKRYHVALNCLPHKHFVILKGVSGSGKSSLAKHYANAVYYLLGKRREDAFISCAVRPDWTDAAEVLGYYDVLSEKYIVPDFLRALLRAKNDPETPVFVCIDEMNLARVEYYFAAVLSAMENADPTRLQNDVHIHLHSLGDSVVDGNGTSLEPETILPRNLYITCTMNVDESTQPVSDKVLDRANVIDMSEVDIGKYLDELASTHPELSATISDCKSLLVAVQETLSPQNLGFAYRTAGEIVRYCSFATNKGGLTLLEAFDAQILQKILTKLRGDDYQSQMLVDLGLLMVKSSDPAAPNQLGDLEKSAREIEKMQSDLAIYQAFGQIR